MFPRYCPALFGPRIFERMGNKFDAWLYRKGIIRTVLLKLDKPLDMGNRERLEYRSLGEYWFWQVPKWAKKIKAGAFPKGSAASSYVGDYYVTEAQLKNTK